MKARSPIRLKDLVAWTGGRTCMTETSLNLQVGAVWMDSRKVRRGDVFLALHGEKDDGHAYVPAALSAGACAAIVARKKLGSFTPADQARCIAVANPLAAIQKAASKYRSILDIPTIALTGSSGKTTTRQFITAVLSVRYPVGGTIGNFNNHIGVPLSILRLSGKENMAVFELGANHRNEINTLTRIVRPDIVCITNIGYAHIGYFGSLNAIAEAKFEIVNGLHGKNSMVLLNGDDPLLVRKNREKGHAAVFFGMSARCAVRAENCSVSASGHTGFSVKGTRYQLSIPGRHFVYCALPAIFLGRQMGIADEEIAQVLRNIEPDSMRGRIVSRAGIRFIVDCYNANPSSMRAGLALLADVTEKKRCAVIGDMLELGTHAKRLHANLGKQIAETGIKKLLAVGTLAAVTAQSAKQHGMKAAGIVTVPDSFAAVEEAHRMFEPGDTVLLKGSRGIKLETVFESYPE